MARRVEEVETEEMLEEVNKWRPVSGGKRAEEEALVRVMDYKTEMCQMIDEIQEVEVFRCIDVEMADTTTSNL